MAVKKIKFNENELLNKGEISFSNSNIVTIVGMNGSGKTVLKNHIAINFKKDWIEQVILKSDYVHIEKSLKDYLGFGVSGKKFIELSKEIKDSSQKQVKDIKNKLHRFIWENMTSSISCVLKQTQPLKKHNEIMAKIEETWIDHVFPIDQIYGISPVINETIKLEKYDQIAKKLQDIFYSKFGNPRIITVEENKLTILEGQICSNGVGAYTMGQLLRDEYQFLVRLLRVAGLEKGFGKIVRGEKQLEKKHIDKVNNWFNSYVSQEIKLHIEISNHYFSIVFKENERNIEFDNLSNGTRKLISIISQIQNINSETIIQIDEPESGMHPIMQIQFRDFLEKISHQHKARFILYTHSTHIVKDGPKTKGLYVMTRQNSLSTLYKQEKYLQEKDILDIQIYESIGFESSEKNYHFDKKKTAVILEGETDIIYMEKMANLLKNNNFQFLRTKLGGVTSMDKTTVLLNAVHNYKKENIIAAPDLDVKSKHPKIIENIEEQDIKIVYVGRDEENLRDVEGMFDEADKRYIVAKYSTNKNSKMNKANLFWREVKSLNDLHKTTIDNFKTFFHQLNAVNKD